MLRCLVIWQKMKMWVSLPWEPTGSSFFELNMQHARVTLPRNVALSLWSYKFFVRGIPLTPFWKVTVWLFFFFWLFFLLKDKKDICLDNRGMEIIYTHQIVTWHPSSSMYTRCCFGSASRWCGVANAAGSAEVDSGTGNDKQPLGEVPVTVKTTAHRNKDDFTVSNSLLWTDRNDSIFLKFECWL